MVLNMSLPAVLATPSGGTFNVGTGSIAHDGLATNVVVDQVQSVINWTSLDTIGGAPGVRESLNFSQGSLINSAVLNRVSGATTQFNGDLNAAGMRIFIVNPAGVVFGEGSTVNVSQLVASGLGMSNTYFLAATADPAHAMVFTSSSSSNRDRVENHGTITATDSVYLVGENVTNTGAILCPGGVVVMAAGDFLLLGQPGSSVIVDISPGNLIADSGNDVTNNGTIGEAGSPVGQLVLAAGDAFSQAITNVGDLAVVTYEDVTFNGDIDVTGSVDVRGGQNPDTDSAIDVHGHITAASIRLKNGTDTGSGIVGEKTHSPIVVDEGKNLTATAGDVVVEAVHDIFLGGNVQASGNIYLNADEDGHGDPREPGYSQYPYGGGDIIANGTLTAGGDVDILANAIRLEADVTATEGDLTITGRTSRDSAGSTQINSNGWGVIQAAEGTILTAGGNVSIIDGGGGPEDSTPPGALTMTGEESLTIVAGAADGVDDGQIILQNVSLGVVGATSLTLEQDLDLDLGDEQWDLFNQSETDLTLISNNGSVTAVETGGNPENAADQWASVGAAADTGITLSGDQGDITTKQLTSVTGDIDVDAKAGQLLANEAIEATAGSVILTAADGIDADGDITAGMDIILNSSTEAAGDLLAGNDIMMNEDITLNGGDWVLTDTEWSWQDGDQSITALAGTVTAAGGIWKETPGELRIYGGDPDLAIDLQHTGEIEDEDAAVATAGNLYILGNGDVQISGDLTALGGEYWGTPDEPVTEEGETVIEPVAVGGVSVVSENGKIYTEDGIDNDTINIAIEGYSDQTEGNIGVDLPYDDGKAAIVLASNDDLKLGEDAGLLAAGLYDASVADDRAAVGFLDESEEIDGLMRNEGDPIDVA
ncbi:MAG: filamentous hemagglutinin N-terminal domain-containing protein, partial [Sedimentisphaerales bacterium]|nr:filamentous hemagglutinin N-terminal domain-containing protein [Sedimentisphaerales bacterium]